MERAVVLTCDDEIGPAELGIKSGALPIQPTELVTLKQLEQAHVTNVLAATGGNKTKACEILGITRAALYNKLSRMQAKSS